MTTCTLGGFTSGTSVKVAVRAKNVFGWGQWSKAVPFKIIKGRTWNRSG